MSNACCIPGCRGNQKHGPKVHSFSFPQDLQLCRKWILAVSSDDFTPTLASRVCELHFHKDDLEYSSTGESSTTDEKATGSPIFPKLKPDAVPSVFLKIKSQTSKPVTEPDVHMNVLDDPIIPLPKASENNVQMLGNLRNGIKFLNPLALSQDLITEAIGNTLAEKKSIKNTIISLKDNMYLIPASYFGKTYINVNGSPIKLPPLQMNQMPMNIVQNAAQQANVDSSEFFVPAVSNIIQPHELTPANHKILLTTSMQTSNYATSSGTIPCDCGQTARVPNSPGTISFNKIKQKLSHKLDSIKNKPAPEQIAPTESPAKEPELVHPIWPKKKANRKLDLEGFSWYDRLGFYKSEVLRAKTVLYKIDCMINKRESELRKLQNELDMTDPLKVLIKQHTPKEARVSLNRREIINYFTCWSRNRFKRVVFEKPDGPKKPKKPPKKRPTVQRVPKYKYRKPHTIPVDCDVPLTFESVRYSYLQEINFDKPVLFINQHNFSEVDYENIRVEMVFFINTSDIITEMCLEMFPPLRNAVETSVVEVVNETHLDSFFRSKSWVYQPVGKQLSMFGTNASRKKEFKAFLLSSVI